MPWYSNLGDWNNWAKPARKQNKTASEGRRGSGVRNVGGARALWWWSMLGLSCRMKPKCSERLHWRCLFRHSNHLERLTAPVLASSRLAQRVPSNLSVPRPPWLKVRPLLMHQSGLQEPLTASRHVFPAVRSKGPIISDWSQSLSVPKKRNVERACDDCRRRKTRCDGPKMPDNVCTNCVQNRKICTYVLAQCPLFQFIQHWFASPQRSLQTSRSSKGVRPAGCCLLFTVSHNVHPVTSQVWKTESKRWRPYWNACVYYSIRPFSPVSAV